MKSTFVYGLIVCILALCITQPSGAMIMCCDNEISANSTAMLVTEGLYTGWYRYTIQLEWDFDKDLSHWDLILKLGCKDPDHLIEGASGSSVKGCAIVEWTGRFKRNGDKSLNPDVTDPVLKYEPDRDPGKVGSGTFIFYSNIIPEDNGPYPDIVVGKAGNCPDTYGPLYGDYPSCNIVPEPATVLLLGLGSLVLIGRKASGR